MSQPSPLWMTAVLLAALGACSGTTGDRVGFDLYFEARSDSGEPVRGVIITGNGQHLGITGRGGQLHAALRARDGVSLRVRAACPVGFREPVQPGVMRLRRFRSVGDSDRGELRVTIECRASERLVALVVQTNKRAGLPVLMDGRELARTNSEGVAHIPLLVAPNSTFQVTIDTSAHPRLRPKSPLGSFAVSDADALVVFEQEFTEHEKKAKKKKRRRRKKARPKPKDTRPTKIQGPGGRVWRGGRG